jgi:glutamine amidotransferase
MEKLGIIDFGSGNLHSVFKAFELVASKSNKDLKVEIVKNSDDLLNCDRIVLPGVGSFADCKTGLEKIDCLSQSLSDLVINKGRPFLGICVGMQLMADQGLENNPTKGFGWIEGSVELINLKSKILKIPHMGWNTLFIENNHKIIEKKENLITTSHHEINLTSMVARDNIIGVQFHPEKSQKLGLKLINNFIEWSP